MNMCNKGVCQPIVGALLFVLFLCVVPVICIAHDVPRDATRAEYLYVFGPEGNAYLGADQVDHQQVVFVDVPENSTADVVIKIYDPDTGGSKDLKPTPGSIWDTVVEFSVYGGSSSPLASKTFSESSENDKRYYAFGPFKKEDGKKIGDIYQFKIVANALEGKDQNLFRLRIQPDNTEVYSDKISFRLLPNEGDEMYFYAEVPAGVEGIIVENYDLDPDGGSASLKDPLTGKVYKVNNSGSGEWASTPINLAVSQQPRRVIYMITKKTQRYANAAVRVKDDKGNILPLYYKPGKPTAVIPAAVKTTPDLKCNKFTFDATSSYDPNKEKISFLWDFGDGTTSTDPVVTHLYEKGGEYTVRLTVKDISGLECDTSVSTQKVKVNTPPQAAFSGPDAACTGNIVTFDAGETTDNTADMLTYSWDFGDGTKGEGKTASKIYQKGGTYKVKLNVNDNAGTACSSGEVFKTITVNSAPVADAGKDIDMCLTVDRDLKINFDGGKSYDPDGNALSYEWGFGDGQTASGKSVSHVFSKPGIYTVSLTVNDGRNSDCSVNTDAVMVRLNQQPIAYSGKDITTCAGSEVLLDGSFSKGEGLKYSWDFGDGETAQGVKVKHTYTKPGNYEAVLTTDDEKQTSCSVASSGVKVFVNGAPQVILDNIGSACLGEKVKFDASAKDPDGDSLVYTWDFGDGTTAKGSASQSHVYNMGGTYRVEVSVDDKKATMCSVSSAASKVRINSRPVANAGPNLVCCLNQETMFDGSGSSDLDGDKLTYRWSFGDGTTQEGAKVKHAYTKSGKYIVMLTVDDNSGTSCSSANSSFEARVNEKPISVIKIK